ncbi:MAG TPA: hypothetical protein VIZ87_09260 [Terrimicrobium sp.]
MKYPAPTNHAEDNFTNGNPPDPGDEGAVLPDNLLFRGEEFVVPDILNSAADFGKSLKDPLRDTAKLQKLAALGAHSFRMAQHHLEKGGNFADLIDELLDQRQSRCLQFARLRIFRLRLRLEFVESGLSGLKIASNLLTPRIRLRKEVFGRLASFSIGGRTRVLGYRQRGLPDTQRFV